jgi:hypothetical protein
MRPVSKIRGMSLVELIIVLVVFLGIVGVVLGVSVMGYRSNVLGEAYVDVQAQARWAMDHMVRELRQAGSVAVVGNDLEFQLNLGVGAPCGAGVACWGAMDQTGTPQAAWRIRYRRDPATSQILREILDAGGVVQPGTRILVNNASQMTFTYTPPPVNTVMAQLQIQRQSSYLPGGILAAAPTPLVFEVQLRN